MYPFRIKALFCTLALLAATLHTLAQVEPFVNVPSPSFGALNTIGGFSAWADYDNDGDLDVCIAGLKYMGGSEARIYRNDGNGTFTDLGTNFGAGNANDSKMTIVWFDYDNDDQLDLLLMTGGPVQLYRNTGGTFTPVGTAGLPVRISVSAAAAGDYDNDGYPDLAVSGSINGTGRESKIYHNNRQGGFEATAIPLTGVGGGDFAWADYDKDGLLDLMMIGFSTESTNRLYRNLGNGNFSGGTMIGIDGFHNGTIAWGDYDNDGYPDLLLSGNSSQGTQYLTRIFHNNGGAGFTNSGIALQGASGSAAWGDYDNDGWLDVVVTGQTQWMPQQSTTNVYRNVSGANFTLVKQLTAATFSSASWADYNNDNRLDLLWMGSEQNSSSACILYRNALPQINSRPNPPTAPAHTISADEKSVTFNWQPALDAQTASPGLYYNIYLYEDPGSAVKMNAHSRPGGYRRLVGMGNTAQNTSYTFHGLSYDKVYRWSVQAIDAAWAGSAFTPEQSFATRKTQTIKLNNLVYPYGSPDFIPATVNSGLPLTIEIGNPKAAELLPDGKIRIKAVDTCTIAVYHHGNSTWLPTTVVTGTMNFTRGTLAVTAHDKQITYGDPLPALTYGITGFANNETESVLTRPVQVSTTATGGSGAGTYPITAGGAAAANYTFTYQPGTLTINPKKLEIVLAPIADKVYGSADFPVGIQADPALPVTFSSSQPGVATIDASGNIHLTGAGITDITATQATGGNYIGDVATVTLRVTPAPQTITFPPMAAKTYGDADFDPQVQSSAGLRVLLSSSDPGVATITPDGKIHITGAGTAIILATQEGNNNYASATANAVLTVNKAAQTVTLQPLPAKTFGDADFAPQAQSSAGLPLQFSSSDVNVATITNDGNIHITGAGAATITATQSGNNNYASATANAVLTVNKAAQTVTLQPLPAKTFGDADFTAQAQSNAGLPVQFSSSDVNVATITSNGTVHITGAGTATITAAQAGNGNYNSASATAVLTVGKAAQTVTLQPLPAKTFGDADFTAQAQSNAGLPVQFSSSDVNVATITSNGTVHITGAGTATITATQSGNGNYNSASAAAVLTVGKAAQTIHLPSLPVKTFGDADFAAGAAATSGLPVSYSSSDVNVATVDAAGQVHITGAGTATITAMQAGNGNYTAALAVTGQLVVKKAAQTISFGPLTTHNVNEPPFDPGATASSGLPVTYEIADVNIATVANTLVTPLRAGTTLITARQPGNANFEAAVAVTRELEIISSGKEIKVNDAVTPNGDGVNDHLQIEGLRNFPDNELHIANASGRMLFEAKPYKNDFRGYANHGSQLLPKGVYYYVFFYTSGGVRKKVTGFFVLEY